MKQLKIAIERAQLTSYSVTFNPEDGKIDVRATIALMTAGGKSITEYSISTSSWQEKDKFELPIECYDPIMKIGNALENVVTQHCKDSTLALNAPDLINTI